jgi:hypothetical protein
MRRMQIIFIAIILITTGCQIGQNDPANAEPRFAIKVERFDSAFFAMDTTRTMYSVTNLIHNYPSFAADFFAQILMLNKALDTNAVRAFYKAYAPIYKDAQKEHAIYKAQDNLEEAFKRVHYYFPNYTLSNKVITFIGPLESYGNIVTKDALALGLQMYLGGQSEWYFSERIQTIYPNYLSRRFAPEYITVNSVQNIINDIVPEPQGNGNLMYEMIEAGKRQYVINKCMPNAPDSIRFGFTQEQVKSVQYQEAKIWEYILHSKLSYSANPADIRSFMQEGVYNDIFGESIPGNVGKYIGYKIVASWMDQKAQKGIHLEQLLKTPADKLFEAAAYNP